MADWKRDKLSKRTLFNWSSIYLTSNQNIVEALSLLGALSTEEWPDPTSPSNSASFIARVKCRNLRVRALNLRQSLTPSRLWTPSCWTLQTLHNSKRRHAEPIRSKISSNYWTVKRTKRRPWWSSTSICSTSTRTRWQRNSNTISRSGWKSKTSWCSIQSIRSRTTRTQSCSTELSSKFSPSMTKLQPHLICTGFSIVAQNRTLCQSRHKLSSYAWASSTRFWSQTSPTIRK